MRGHKRDLIETKRAHFKDSRSFVSLEGHLFLQGKDWNEQKIRVLARDNFTCQGCHRAFDLDYDLIDPHHIVKKSDGGSDDLSNLVSLHRNCHSKFHPEKQTQFGGRKENVG